METKITGHAVTDQYIFDTVAKHLFAQGERAYDLHDGKCSFRVFRDRLRPMKCAIGCLIPDLVYEPEMEGHGSAHTLIAEYRTLQNHLGTNTRLLNALRDVHDEATSWVTSGRMQTNLHAVALVFKLDYKIVQGLRFADR